MAEQVDARYPFSMTTGRLRDQWHAMSRTGLVAKLFAHEPEPAIELSPADMARRGWRDGQLLKLKTRRGTQVAAAKSNAGVQPGNAYFPMHWGEEFLGGAGAFGVNTLTQPAFDALSFQPELKHAALRIETAELPWRLAGFAIFTQDQAWPRLQALRALCKGMAFYNVTPFGGADDAHTGVLLQAAAEAAPAQDVLDALAQLLGLEGQLLRYHDARKQTTRLLRLDGGKLLAGLLHGNEAAVAAQGWLRELAAASQDAAALGNRLLMPGATAPSGMVRKSRTVCTCMQVGEKEILDFLGNCPGGDAEWMDALQKALGCGTQCGSCKPELAAMLRQQKAVA